MNITADDIKFVNIDKFQYVDYQISLPTHYNKHDIIVNSYKYDIKSHALNFLIYKIKNRELLFTINDEYNETMLLSHLITLSHDEAKKIYTKLSGLLVREDKRYYDELLKSSVKTMEDLINLNMKMGLTDIKILKVFVDEFIVDKPLLIKNIPNQFIYNFDESKFIMFIKSLDLVKKQMYIYDDRLEINLDFYYKDANLLTDLTELLTSSDFYDKIDYFTSDLIHNRYDYKKLVMLDDNKPFIYYDGVKIPFIDSQMYKYDTNYYYNIYKDIASNIVLAKTY